MESSSMNMPPPVLSLSSILPPPSVALRFYTPKDTSYALVKMLFQFLKLL